jgi:hypothetical protein
MRAVLLPRGTSREEGEREREKREETKGGNVHCGGKKKK